MSAPKNGRTNPELLPAGVREYRDRLDAFNLAAAEWLGIDPAQVTRFDLTEGREPEFAAGGVTSGTYTQATWESLTEQVPRVGSYSRGARWDGDTTWFTAVLAIDWLDDRERRAVTGPKPDPREMFTPVERIQLERLRDTM